jgi:hypothetical protein
LENRATVLFQAAEKQEAVASSESKHEALHSTLQVTIRCIMTKN